MLSYIGFRVHAHLACLASGVPSVLIAEDAELVAKTI